MGACFSRSVDLHTSRINLRAAGHADAQGPRALPIHEFLPPNHPKPADYYCCKIFEALAKTDPSSAHGESGLSTVLDRQGDDSFELESALFKKVEDIVSQPWALLTEKDLAEAWRACLTERGLESNAPDGKHDAVVICAFIRIFSKQALMRLHFEAFFPEYRSIKQAHQGETAQSMRTDLPPRLRSFLKSLPSHSVNRPSFSNLNGKVVFADGPKESWLSKTVVCRHLALAWLENVAGELPLENDHISHNDDRPVRLKPDYRHFNSATAIEKLPYRLKKNFGDLFNHGREVHLFVSEYFGNFLSKQFSLLLEDDNKLFLILSTNHAMALAIHKKPSEENRPAQYAMKFYDPNLTDVHVRAAGEDAGYCQGWSLRNLICNDSYSNYFPPSEDNEVVIAIGFDSLSDVLPPLSPRKLTNSVQKLPLKSSKIIDDLFILKLDSDLSEFLLTTQKLTLGNQSDLMNFLTAKSGRSPSLLPESVDPGHSFDPSH
jgi:hypothetical protein